MAKRPSKTLENGMERQKRIQREQHRPEQNKGYDDAVNGGPTANDRQILNNLGTPDVLGDATAGPTGIDDREADAAAMDVRRHEHSAD
jgi:hypothetical protein